MQREELISTAIRHSVGVPHAYMDAMKLPTVVFVRLEHPMNLGAPDGIATRFLFVLLGPAERGIEHLDTLTNIARLMSDEEFRFEAGEARSPQEIIAALDHFEERTRLPAAPTETEIPEGLRYTGKLFGGIVGDFKRRIGHYGDDFRQGLHPKCIGASLFLFFACLAPTVTFGGVMAELTDGHIGAVEMLISTSICGVIYALFSGHPLNILGGTGPMLIYTALLYQLCNDMGIAEHFLATYAWVGLWTAAFILILAAMDASCLMRFFTRFTNEIFAGLISTIYIYEALRALVLIFVKVYDSENAGQFSHDDALIPLLLAIGTYSIATSLVRFRQSHYLISNLREFLADFGPAIAIGTMSLVYVWLHNAQPIHIDELPAPDRLQPTYAVPTEDQGGSQASGTTGEQAVGEPRSWFVNPLSAPTWVWFAAAIPAFLGTLLVFLDHNITARIIYDPSHRLRKGVAYHWDLMVTGGLVGFCSMFGLPWQVAATVRSLNHLRSVATIEEQVGPRGEIRDHIIHVRENRVTGLIIHLMVGASLLALPWLKMIPMAVLYGLFLFMGVVSIAGNQFLERLNLWLMDPALYPKTHYIRRVALRRVHLFTMVQLTCLVVLWVVKSSSLGILFPLFIAILVPVRLLLNRYFSPRELAALDAEAEPEDEELHWR
jgi:mannitol/fructose-specific phosphotransferase system IIA component